jgi:dTDP-4-amino-4,6-dideoxygalactose transaminase
MPSINVPLTRPYVGDEEKTVLTAIIESGWLTQGPRVTEFEDLVAQYIGTKHAIACSNCTTALHISLLLYGIGPGDEVIVPSYTWIATANVVRMVGAMPVFADIDLDTFNIAAPAIEMAITERTRAIMLVHQFGLPADMESIVKVAQRHRLIVIEDAACALGSLYEGRPIGSSGNVTCFSFHPRKVISTGEGGMLVTDDADLASRARVLLNHGASVSDLIKHKAGTVEALLAEEFHEVGYNYRMTNLQGALGVTQMERLDEILALRRMRAERYSEDFTGMSYIIPPQVPDYATPNWQSYAIRISDDCPVARNAIAQHLLNAGIACRPAYMACHVQPIYRDFYPDLYLPNTEKALSSVLILPLFPQMTEEDQHYMVKVLREACQAA